MATLKRKAQGGKIEFMMTPMIDIVFQLIIFFMLMPTQLAEGYLPTNLPNDLGVEQQTMVPPTGIRIELQHVESQESAASTAWDPNWGAEVRVLLNQEEVAAENTNPNAPDQKVSFGKLRQLLKDKYDILKGSGADLDKLPVIIQPDRVVWHKHVVAAFDAAVDAGFKNIQFNVPR